MKNQQFLFLAPIFLAMALNVISLNAHADETHYVYTNDGQVDNTVTGFEVAPDGSLTKVGQWHTGGIGCPHGVIAGTRATTSEDGKLLFVSNGFYSPSTDPQCETSDATISVFTRASDGNLSLVGEPFSDPVHLSPGDTTVASFGNCLILGAANGNKLISYSLSYTPLVVTFVNTSDLGYYINDMKITKVGNTRYAAATFLDNTQIAVTPINSDTCALGSTTMIDTQGVKLGPQGGGPAGLGFSPDGNKMYVAIQNRTKTIVEAFNFPSGTPLAGSPYVYPPGNGSSTVLVSNDGSCLFVANRFYAKVTSIPLLSSGVPGPSAKAYQVGSTSPLEFPIGLANDIDGNKLYVSIHPDNSLARDNTVITELIGTNYTLTEAPGGAVPTGVTSDVGFQTSIVATGGN